MTDRQANRQEKRIRQVDTLVGAAEMATVVAAATAAAAAAAAVATAAAAAPGTTSVGAVAVVRPRAGC
jgi:hypothetical protein